MLSQVTGVAPGVFADFGSTSRSGIATYAKKEIVLKGDCSVRLPYNEDGTINYDTLEQLVFRFLRKPGVGRMSKTMFASPYVKNGAEFFAAHIGCQLSALSCLMYILIIKFTNTSVDNFTEVF